MSDTGSLLELARRHMTPNYSPPPFVVARGRGTRLWDTDGKEYLDFAGGIGVNALGHAHPRVVAAIGRQAALFAHTSNLLHHGPYIEMCARLARLSFGTRVFLANSGAEAVEAAFKLVRRYFFARGDARAEVVAAHNSFHGRTFGALSLTGQPEYHRGFTPLVPGVTHVPFGDICALEQAVGPATAAVLLEPIQGNGGVLLPPPGYLARVRELCDAAGCLLVFDEVQTGVGRTGRWFAHDHEGVFPDIMAVAKALGGGLPLGAMVTTEEIAAVLSPGSHATTFGGNPIACAAGLATLDVIEEQGLLDHAARAGDELVALLAGLGDRHPSVRGARGRGLMVGLLVDGPAKPLQQACRERGLLATVAGGSVLRLLPPLNVSDQEIEQAVGIIDAALA